MWTHLREIDTILEHFLLKSVNQIEFLLKLQKKDNLHEDHCKYLLILQ